MGKGKEMSLYDPKLYERMEKTKGISTAL